MFVAEPLLQLLRAAAFLGVLFLRLLVDSEPINHPLSPPCPSASLRCSCYLLQQACYLLASTLSSSVQRRLFLQPAHRAACTLASVQRHLPAPAAAVVPDTLHYTGNIIMSFLLQLACALGLTPAVAVKML